MQVYIISATVIIVEAVLLFAAFFKQLETMFKNLLGKITKKCHKEHLR